ncbi:flavin monoamine oxidase family protein [Amycolatopsis japonica]|uniref:flavin monoamine oxidase family protein n=1 Tax=Amycolatopsis japonica TaxID=208439 RepID=UPI0036705F8F
MSIVTTQPSDGLSRRGLLTAAGAAAVGLGVVQGQAVADEVAGYDALVIGGGFAGATAARELRARGRRPLVLEARDRIGGRTWTDTFLGKRIERGGTWVHWSQPHVWAEMMRYGLPIVEDPGPDRVILSTDAGPRSFPPAEAFGRIGELLNRVFEGSTALFDRPFDPLFREAEVRAIDGLSLRGRLDQLRLSPQDEGWINGFTASYAGGTNARGAYTQMAKWWALAGGTNSAWGTATGHYRVEPGTGALLQAILADSGAQVRLRTPVASVVDNGKQVEVTTRSGERFAAPIAVVAVPVNVWKTISFAPALPAAHAAATREGIGVPNGTKIWLHIRGDIGRVYAQPAEGNPIGSLIPFASLDDGQLFVAFSFHSTFDGTDLRQVRDAVRALEPKADVVSIKSQNWAKDEFSLGAAAYMQPGQLTRLHEALQRPSGRVAFATSDIALGWNGYIDGAIESGVRAVRSLG